MKNGLICRDMMLPVILRRYPSCRKVFDRYGLEGCGGPCGPEEALWFFARAHRLRSLILEQSAPAGRISDIVQAYPVAP